MACEECERRRAQMKEWLKQKAEQVAKWARVRNAKQATNAQAKSGRGAKARTEDSGQAGTSGAEHQQREVEAVEAGSADAGRVSVSRVRKAGRRN